MTRIAKKVCKKLLVFTAVVVGSCCVLFGCNKTGDSQSSSSTPAPTPAHTHTLTKVTANAPTCTQTGNEEYFVCECGDMFADENANTALTAIPVLEKTAHSHTQEVAEQAYFVTGATCTQKATYYKSCTCGDKGTTTFEYGNFASHDCTQEVVEQKYLATNATCTQKATYYKSCTCGEKGTTTFEYGDFATHDYTQQVTAPKYLATNATCEEKATYYKSCTCGKKGTTTFEYGDFAPHKSFDLIISDSALVEQTADTYYLSCTDCGELSQETTTVNEFIGVENGMAFTQLAGFSLAIPENSTLQLKALKVKLTDGTLKAEYTGGSFDNFNTAFNALSPKYTYLLEYTVFNGTDSETYDGVVDFSVNTVDTVAIAQTQSQMETNLMPTGSKARLIYTESNIGGRKSAYEWTTGSSSSTQGNATISLTNNTLNKKNAVTGKYFYFDIYTTHDFPITYIDATTTGGKTHQLHQYSYDFIKKYDSTTGAKITSNAQSTWKGKWVTIEIRLQCDWYFDSNYRGLTIPANNDYGLPNTDSKHIYLDNFRISTYSIYAQIDGVSECSEHDFISCVPQPKYLAQKATCQAPASFYKSCSVCGALGTETFTAGNIGTHDYAQNTASEFLATKATCLTPAKYYYSCSTCSYKHAKTFTYGTVGDHECNREVASEQYLVSEKTPTQNAIYYKSCVCGLAGTDTFEYDDTLPESVYVMVNPNKTEYANGEKFDKTGMVVMAYLRNGEEVTVTDYTLSHTTLTYPLNSVTISYLGVQTEIAVTVYEFTVADAIAEVANAYDRQSSQIHYDQYNSRRHLTVSPEEATAQRTIYLDCSSFVNSVYRETFGVNVIPYMENSLGSMPDGSWTPSTSNFNSYAKNYTDNVDVVGFWRNEEYTTTAEQQELLASVRSMLQVGDVLNYRHHTPGSSSYKGHVYIYLGDDTFIHHAGAGSYHVNSSDPALSYDEEGAPYNSIITSDADELFTDTSNTRYLFKKTSSDEVSTFMILRPLARGLSLTQKTINRMQIAGISMEKVSSVGINSAVRTGDTITYTITLDNKVSKTHSAVMVSDIVPAGTEFVEGTTGVVVDGSNLSWTVNVGSKAKVTLSYTVRVTQTQAGALIVSDSTFVGGLNLGTITHSVAGYTVEQTNAVVEKANAFVTAQRAFSDPIAFAQALYSEALGVSVFNYATTANALADVIDVTNNKARTDTALSKMIAPNLYGGLDIASGQYKLEDTQRCRLVTEAQLAVGDIILAEWSGGSRVYVYIGNAKLICCSTTNLTCHELTIGTNIYSGADNILVSFIAYDGYAVIRPSMVVTA